MASLQSVSDGTGDAAYTESSQKREVLLCLRAADFSACVTKTVVTHIVIAKVSINVMLRERQHRRGKWE